MSDSRTVTTFITHRPRPYQAPEGWTIWNAPRPLYGSVEWQGDFLHGIFYVAIAPDEQRSAWMIAENASLDGWVIEFIDDDAYAKIVTEMAKALATKCAMTDDEVREQMTDGDLWQSWHDKHGRREEIITR